MMMNDGSWGVAQQQPDLNAVSWIIILYEPENSGMIRIVIV